jgi:branched-chain amino acid transport system permease protein
MARGYVCALLVNQSSWPFFEAPPIAFVASALIGAVMEGLLHRNLYNRTPSRPGAVHRRPAVKCGLQLDKADPMRDPLARSILRHRHRPLPAVDHCDPRPIYDRASIGAVAHPVW